MSYLFAVENSIMAEEGNIVLKTVQFDARFPNQNQTRLVLHFDKQKNFYEFQSIKFNNYIFKQ